MFEKQEKSQVFGVRGQSKMQEWNTEIQEWNNEIQSLQGCVCDSVIWACN